jgi:hypothetical protein
LVSSASGSSRSSASADITKPGVQNPHWKPKLSMNACCSGCKVSPSARPSMVTTSAPSACTASMRHERTGSPFTSTVHAPHTPCSHPRWVPVSSSFSRRKSASDVRTSAAAERDAPFTVSSIVLSIIPSIMAVPFRRPW